jgi:glycosyltransferase involved in cell wall biosynthesis
VTAGVDLDALYRTAVPPVLPGTARPLWSVMIPTYECGATIAETLLSVLDQDPGPDLMQIEVVDDASTRDDIATLVQEIGRGRVAFARQPRNLGVVGNLGDCIRRSRGRLVHLLHGDDLVLPGYYAAIGRAFAARPDLGAAFCRHRYIDAEGREIGVGDLERTEPGVLDDAPVRLAREQRVMTPSITVRRAVYETIGAFDARLACSEDWEMWVRIAAAYPVWYEPSVLAAYRMHDQSNTGRNTRVGRDIDYCALAIDLMARYLDGSVAEDVRRSARTTYAVAALQAAEQALAAGRLSTAAVQFRGAFRLSAAPRVLLAAARLPAGAARRRLLGGPNSHEADPSGPARS